MITPTSMNSKSSFFHLVVLLWVYFFSFRGNNIVCGDGVPMYLPRNDSHDATNPYERLCSNNMNKTTIMPLIANGYLSHKILNVFKEEKDYDPMQDNIFFVKGLYNGNISDNFHAHYAVIPSAIDVRFQLMASPAHAENSFSLKEQNVNGVKAELDLSTAIYTQTEVLSSEDISCSVHIDEILACNNEDLTKIMLLKNQAVNSVLREHRYSNQVQCLSPQKSRVTVISKQYAHRLYKELYVLDVTIENSGENIETINLLFNTNITTTPDIEFQEITSFFTKQYPFLERQYKIYQGKTTVPELESIPVIDVLYIVPILPEKVKIKSKEKIHLTYLSTIHTNLQEDIQINKILSHEFTHYLQMASKNILEKSHIDEWQEVIRNQGIEVEEASPTEKEKMQWNSEIKGKEREDIFDSPLSLPLAVNVSLFGLVSNMREDWPFGLAPGGISEAYNGHVFWDADLWMIPALLITFPQLSKSFFQYRKATLSGAFENAKNDGYQGAKFAWESAKTGTETCPPAAKQNYQELHINGDIIISLWKYYLLSLDNLFLKEVAYPIMKSICDFWISRVRMVEEGGQVISSHIDLIVPPDEYAIYVNDSVYTNMAAKQSLNYTMTAAKILNLENEEKNYPKWEVVAETLVELVSALDMAPLFTTTVSNQAKKIMNGDYISKTKNDIGMELTKSNQSNYHPEYLDYTQGTVVKQADVILLGFPLELPLSKDMQMNDLEYYSKYTDENGPAMTWAMHAINYLSENVLDLSKAESFFTKSYAPYIHLPFGVWTEAINGQGAYNFLTGAGGFLQSVLYGWAGIRLQLDNIRFTMRCPNNVKKLKLKGVEYGGAKFDISWECTKEESKEIRIEVSFKDPQQSLDVFVETNQTSMEKRQKVSNSKNFIVNEGDRVLLSKSSSKK